MCFIRWLQKQFMRGGGGGGGVEIEREMEFEGKDGFNTEGT